MYKLQTILNDLLRHRRRFIISCLLLTSCVSLIFCGFFHKNYAAQEIAAVEQRYADRYYIAFRDELQYDPNHPSYSEGEIRLNGTSTTDGIPDVFFNDDKMKKYDHPYSVTLEHYGTLGTSELCDSYKIAYADNAYGFAEELPEWMQENLDAIYSANGTTKSKDKILTEHIVVGGDLNAFTAIARENSSDLYDFILIEGKEPKAGECVITSFYADIYNKSVGNTITLFDIYGQPLVNLTISGIYDLYLVSRYEYADPNIPETCRKLTGSSLMYDYSGNPDIGTPYDRIGEDMDAWEYSQANYFNEYFRVSEAMIALIHTDLETAYYLYGTPETDRDFEERHHFNNYFAYFEMKPGFSGADLENEMVSVFPEVFKEEFTVYPFDRSLAEFKQLPQGLDVTADTLLKFSIPLGIVVVLIVFISLTWENSKEIGIYLSVGVSEKDIVYKLSIENTILTIISVLAASLCGRFVHNALSVNYIYLELMRPQYAVTGSGMLFSLLLIIGVFLLSALFTLMYIHINTPIRLIRQE